MTTEELVPHHLTFPTSGSGSKLASRGGGPVGQLEGPVRVVAGAGTGKTAVIAERFARLVQAGVDPASILVMTFTERAAGEMRERIEAGLEGWPALNVGTFHSLAQGWLQEDGWRVDVPRGFGILAGPDRWIVLRELLWDLGDPALVEEEDPDRLVTPLLRLLERIKQEMVPLARLRAWAAAHDSAEEQRMAAVASLFDAYSGHCRRHRQLDFDDLIERAVALLESSQEVLATYRSRFGWIMVDEYQDTNLAQERVVELLAAGHGNVCVVGDDDQSIYRFRGASRANLERFLDHFPSARTYPLGRNRRSGEEIVAAAAALIGHNLDRLPKSLSSTRGRLRPVELVGFADGRSEAEAMARRIAELRDGGLELSRIAVLTRTHAVLWPVLAALEAAQLPYQLWGARGFHDRPEIRDLIAYLRVIADPAAELPLVRVLTRPPLSLDLELVLVTLAEARRTGIPPLEAVGRLSHLAEWRRVMAELIDLRSRLGIDDLFFELMARTRYLEGWRELRPIELAQLSANVERFGEMASGFCSTSPDHSLSAFMARLDLILISGVDDELARIETDEPAVQVMTIHQAKGLEFEAVFVPSVVEGRLPQRRRQDQLQLPPAILDSGAAREDHEAEERRLLYVAMTRARSHLHLSWSPHYEGARTWRPSRFLSETDLPIPTPQPAEARLASLSPRRPVPNPDTNTSPTLSFSSIASYRECPRQYWFRYRHRLPVATRPEAAYGTIVHDALRRAGLLRRSGLPVLEDDLNGCIEAAWSSAGFPDARRRPALESLSRTQLQRYLAGGGLTPVPHLVEHSFEMDMDGWRLSGVIDRVDPPPEPGASWRLIDYKTGSIPPRSRLRRDLQLSLYALAARRALGLAPLELELVHLRDGRRLVIPATEDLLDEAAKAGVEVAAGVRSGDFETRPSPRRCQLCPYRQACPQAM